jgi:hypothetical protein
VSDIGVAVFRDHFVAAVNGLLLLEEAIAQWHAALKRVERAAIALVIDSLDGDSPAERRELEATA